MVIASLVASNCCAALSYTIVYEDDAGVGFKDSTEGATRKAALERAVEIWMSQLDGTIEINIAACFAFSPAVAAV